MRYLMKHDPNFLFNKWLEENFPLLKRWEEFEKPMWYTERLFPFVDIKEEEDHYLLRMDIPGMKLEDIEITTENNMLLIKGKRESEWEEKREEWMHAERSFGSFSRSFILHDMDASKIKATIEKGVLSLEVPKLRKAESRKIKITMKD